MSEKKLIKILIFFDDKLNKIITSPAKEKLKHG